MNVPKDVKIEFHPGEMTEPATFPLSRTRVMCYIEGTSSGIQERALPSGFFG